MTVDSPELAARLGAVEKENAELRQGKGQTILCMCVLFYFDCAECHDRVV